MNELIVALAVAVQLAAGGAEPRDGGHAAGAGDAVRVQLPGEDRFRHFAASYGAASMAFGAVRALDRDAAMPAAIAIAAALGVAKEVHDRRRGARFDLVDIAANAAGIAAAYFFLREMR